MRGQCTLLYWGFIIFCYLNGNTSLIILYIYIYISFGILRSEGSAFLWEMLNSLRWVNIAVVYGYTQPVWGFLHGPSFKPCASGNQFIMLVSLVRAALTRWKSAILWRRPWQRVNDMLGIWMLRVSMFFLINWFLDIAVIPSDQSFFLTMGIQPWEALKEAKFEIMTEIQAKSIPHLLNGKDATSLGTHVPRRSDF